MDTSKLHLPPELEDAVAHCNRCGFCQAGCPVYKVTGVEWSVARGRIALVRDVLEGRIELDEEVREPFFNCLLCNGCSAHCPAGIKTDELMTRAREELMRRKGQPWVEKLLFRGVLRKPGLISSASRAIRLAQMTGMQSMVEASGVLENFGDLGKASGSLPSIPKTTARAAVKEVLQPPTIPDYRVAYFIGCATNYLYPAVAQSLVRVLQHANVEVVVPEHLCCGKPPTVYGDKEAARLLASENIAILDAMGVDAIVTDCATCGSFLKTYDKLIGVGSRYSEAAARVKQKVRDISEFLCELDFSADIRKLKERVTYHDPCHLGRFQDLKAQPRRLLRSIPGVELVESVDADMCCGGAGSYGITHYDLSSKILDRKMANVAATGAGTLATGCPACMMQLSFGAKRQNMSLRVVHTVQLLDEASR